VRAGASVCGGCGAQLTFAPPQLPPGYRLANGRYSILSVLSHGGMGMLYLAADHEAFDRTVVIKALLNYFDPADPQQVQMARARFLDEARVLASLRHPAIPQAIGVFWDGPRSYIAMEYIEGENLEQGLTHTDAADGTLVPGGPYAYATVLQWGVALCGVLEYLAGRRPHPVVHHDIKPANLVRDRSSNTIRLIDFGTARVPLLAREGQRVEMRRPSVYGTPGYAPPEQYRGQSDPAGDVYALAATLYHLATDDDPRAHPFAFPALDQLGLLGECLRSALAMELADRPAAGALREQLERALMSTSTRVFHAPGGDVIPDVAALARWCETHWQSAAAWLYGSLPEQIEVVWGMAGLADNLRTIVRQYGADWNVGLDAALALLDPPGYGAAPTRLAADAQALTFGPLAPLKHDDRVLTLTNTGRRWVQARLHLPAWVTADQATVVLPPGRQASVTLTARRPARRLGGTLRDDLLVDSGGPTLLRLEARAGMAYPPAIRRSFALLLFVAALLFSGAIKADLEALATLFRPNLPALAAATMPAATGTPLFVSVVCPSPVAGQSQSCTIPTPAAFIMMTPTTEMFVSNGQSTPVVFIDQTSQAVASAVACLEPTIGPNMPAATPTPPVITPARGGPTTASPWQTGQIRAARQLWVDSGVFSLAFSPDGRLLAFGRGDGAVVLQRVADDTVLHSLVGNHEFVEGVTFSPDGQLLAADHGNIVELWRVEDGTLIRTIAGHHPHTRSQAAFSPDGQLLATSEWDVIRIWRVEDGTLLRTLAGYKYAVERLAFSADGATLFSSGPDGLWLWRVEDGMLLRSQAQGGSYVTDLVLSDDGQILAVGDRPPSVWVNQIKLWQPNSGALLRTIECGHGETLAFSPDGQVLAAGDAQAVKLWRVADGQSIATLAKGGGNKRLAFSPDGQLLVSVEGNNITIWRSEP
jgi:tRNA A-37 threonylcarbamoyl transferase component Bud32/sugar lactone lactonase YvrE